MSRLDKLSIYDYYFYCDIRWWCLFISTIIFYVFLAMGQTDYFTDEQRDFLNRNKISPPLLDNGEMPDIIRRNLEFEERE